MASPSNSSMNNRSIQYSHMAYINVGCCSKCNPNPETKFGQRVQTLKIIVLATLPIFTLMIQSSVLLHTATRDLESKLKVKMDISFSTETSILIQYTQLERGLTTLYLVSLGDEGIYKNLTLMYRNSDLAIQNLSRWPIVEGDPAHFKSRSTFFETNVNFRKQVNANSTTIREVLSYYSKNIVVIIGWMANSFQSKSGSVWKSLVAYHLLILSKEEAGNERALGSSYFAKGGFPTDDYLWYMEKSILGQHYLDRSRQYSNRVEEIMDSQLSNTSLLTELKQLRQTIIRNAPSTNISVESGVHWFDKMSEYINILKYTQDTLGNEIISTLESEIEDLRQDYIVSILILVGVLVILPAIIIIVYRQTNKIQIYAKTLHQKTSELELERKRSETLLYQMLPVTVAKKLMSKLPVLPREYPSASVFFSDIVGFTSICSRLKPIQVIDMLNSLYKTFDDQLEKYDVYKVETIGDAYMVVSGVPQANEKHVVEISNLALNILDVIPRLVIPMLTEMLQVRIGINTGPVVAGVVGRKMPRYCLFGDTVNVASRMESTGRPQKIQLSTSTYKSLLPYPEFVTQERGEVTIKGKGLMTTYWLLKSETHLLRTPTELERRPPL